MHQDPIAIAVVDSGWNSNASCDQVSSHESYCVLAHRYSGLVEPTYHDYLGHGTAVTEEILRLAPTARIIPVKLFHRNLFTTEEALVEALSYAISTPALVVSMSLGMTADSRLDRLYNLCEKARRMGKVLVSAHSNTCEALFPASFNNVIGVRGAVVSGPERIYTFGCGQSNALVTTQETRTGWSETNSLAVSAVSGSIARVFPTHETKAVVPASVVASCQNFAGSYLRSADRVDRPEDEAGEYEVVLRHLSAYANGLAGTVYDTFGENASVEILGRGQIADGRRSIRRLFEQGLNRVTAIQALAVHPLRFGNFIVLDECVLTFQRDHTTIERRCSAIYFVKAGKIQSLRLAMEDL